MFCRPRRLYLTLALVALAGLDDYKPLEISGGNGPRAAAPIWAQFMKAAMQYPQYRDVKDFQAPDGIVSIDIDPQSGMVATPSCPTRRTEVYIAGTQPVGLCPLHGGGRSVTNVAGWDIAPPPAAAAPSGDTAPRVTGSGNDGQVQPPPANRRVTRQDAQATPTAQPAPQPAQPKKDEKKGILRRLIGVFK